MRFSIIATLIAVVAASPIPDTLAPRSCSALGTKTIGGQSLKGPFKIQAIGDFSKSGNYASAGTSGKIKYDIGGPRKAEASEFYLTGAGNLVTVNNGRVLGTFEYSAQTNVQVGGGSPKVVCKYNSGSCALTCSVGTQKYNCLSSPGYVPDWRISAAKAGSGPGCVPFTPTVVTS